MYDLDKNIEILKNSKSKLVELEKMNDFFKTLDLSSVLINTSLIISYFESNIEREDLGKLELFNLQYTDSLLELLRKVKSNKEREIASVTIKYNRFIYEQKRIVYNNPNLDEEFVISKKLHELEISLLFENFFNNIEYKDFNKLKSFHKKYSSRYFYNIDENDKKFIESKNIKYYTRFNTKIDSELLEIAANNKFKIKLSYGFNSKETSFELFIVENSDIVFLWNINKNTFYISQSNFYSFGEMLNSTQTKIENYSGKLQDSINEILKDIPKGVNKILILGEKDFGYNSGKVDLNSRKHKEWRWFLSDLFKLFEVVSFDNLALEQLKPERFLTKKDFEIFNQGEYSMYINAVEGYYSPSSRSNHRMYWNKISIKEFFSIKDYFDKCYPKQLI